MSTSAPNWRKDAIATPLGWAHPKSGEQLSVRRDLTDQPGSAGYVPNDKAWMTAYQVNRPKNTVAPAVTGTATVGQTLTTTNGTWTGTPAPTYTRQWTRDGVAIAGQTALTYVLVADDAGKTIRCVVTATNTTGIVTATSNGVAVPA